MTSSVYCKYKQYFDLPIAPLAATAFFMHAPDTPLALPPGNWWLQALPASIAAGFPSPAEDHQVERIDLMQQLVKHPQATFYIRVRGESMRDAGILDGSVVLVDRAITPADGQIVLAVVDGDFTCKTLRLNPQGLRLQAAHPDYPDIVPKDGQSVEIWGVVVATIHQHST
jgi:DNA polymerase V